MQTDLPEQLGINQGAYLGERLDLDPMLQHLKTCVNSLGWKKEALRFGDEEEASLLCLTRRPAKPLANIILSGGIHGDEPATTAALCQMVLEDVLPQTHAYTVFPCLNPCGMRAGTRVTSNGRDLNRDYLTLETREVQAHVRKLKKLHPPDLALQLHEDWEAHGFYLYELAAPGVAPLLGRPALDAVAEQCPIETASSIEGYPADRGWILPELNACERNDWPEAFYFMQHKTRHSLTLESPSDFDMSVRIQALIKASLAALKQLPTVPDESHSAGDTSDVPGNLSTG